ncbi:MAG TPA: hypothetical protein VJ949_07860, partial [Cryomorphaceae bacterium]|nr:hypothetical protein [Cryomorphaceae bacterium]
LLNTEISLIFAANSEIVRRFFTLFLFIIYCGIATGQSKFSMGPMAGFNVAKFSSTSEASATARPFLGIYSQYRPIDLFSAEVNAAYSMRGERLDQKTLRFESSFIDAHLLVKIHFLEAFSFGAGIGYYHALNAKAVNRITTDNLFERQLEDVNDLSQAVVPLELGFQFQNEATLHFSYGLGMNGGFNNPALTFRFPIRIGSKENKPPGRRAVAKNQVRQLHEGALLVRLPTAQPLIDALAQQGREDQADDILKGVEQSNREIVSAFKSNYFFSEVYFFYSNNSKEIRNGNLSSLMSADLEAVSFPKGETLPDYFIAEFDNLQPDTGRYYIGSAIVPDPDGGLRRVKRYGDSDIGANFRALVIKDQNFVQLRDPFPYYVRSFKKSWDEVPEELIFLFPLTPSLNIDHGEAVRKLDKKLRRFGNVEKEKG